MKRAEMSFRRLVAYTVGGAGILAFVLFLRALFMTQSETAAGRLAPAGLADDPFGVTLLPEEGDESDPAWSPDGRYIAYVSSREGKPYLLRRDLQTNEVTPIAEDAWGPAWSPDGAHLAYSRPNPAGASDTYMTGFDGAPPVKINDHPEAWNPLWLPDSQSILLSTHDGQIRIMALDGTLQRSLALPAGGFTAHSLSADGTRLLATAFGGSSLQLIHVDLQTGQMIPLTPDDQTPSGGQWSPNQEFIVYRAANFETQETTMLHILRAQDGQASLLALAPPGQYIGQFAWSPDSRFVAYATYPSASVMDGGEVHVVWADGSKTVSLAPGWIARTFAWSPDGTQIALSLRNGDQFDLALAHTDEASLLARLARPTPPPIPTLFATATLVETATPFPLPTPFSDRDFYWPDRLTSDPAGNYRPAVSPDGQRIAFASERNGNWDIYLFDRSSQTETRLTDDPLNDMAPSWSPDGTRIAYQHNIPDPSGPVLVERVVMNADGSGKTVVARGGVWIGNEPPAWSPSSDRIAFSDGKDVVVASAADGREIVRFTPPETAAYYQPAWVDDDRIAFNGNGQIRIGEIGSGEVSMVFSTPGFAQMPLAARPDSRIAYFSLEGGNVRLLSARLDGTEPGTLAQFAANTIQQAAWSPDGRFIAYYADDSVHVSIAWSDQFRDNAPLFVIPNVTGGLSDLVGLAWLADSSGFVYVAENEGQPDLYLATLNQEAIQAYVDHYPIYAPTQFRLPPTPAPTATPLATPTAIP